MFSDRSRYKSVPTDQVTLADGRTVTAVRFALRSRPVLLGYHRRLEGQRLDHLANFYLKDAARFWRLCDANDAQSPHALGVHDLIGIPGQER
jgi:hypothetical protein